MKINKQDERLKYNVLYRYLVQYLKNKSDCNECITYKQIQSRKEKTTLSINDSSNMSMADFVPSFLKDSKGGLSFWFFVLIGGVFFWIISRITRRHSFY